MIVPAPAVPGVLTDAEESGVKSATVYASMMGDGEDPESQRRGIWLKDFVAKSRLRVAGPNCMGAYSYRERLLGYPNTDLCRLAPGAVACIFQSGGLIQFFMRAAADRGLRYSYCITSGNEPDLGLADYLNFVIDDPETRQIVLFIEGIRRPEAFMHAAGRARHGQAHHRHQDRRHRESQAASHSHTGAIAGDYASYLAMRALRHRQLRLARRSRRDGAGLQQPATAEGRASPSSPRREQPAICSTIMPRPRARSCPTSRLQPRLRSSR